MPELPPEQRAVKSVRDHNQQRAALAARDRRENTVSEVTTPTILEDAEELARWLRNDYEAGEEAILEHVERAERIVETLKSPPWEAFRG